VLFSSFQVADCGLRAADFGWWVAGCGLQVADCGFRCSVVGCRFFEDGSRGYLAAHLEVFEEVYEV